MVLESTRLKCTAEPCGLIYMDNINTRNILLEFWHLLNKYVGCIWIHSSPRHIRCFPKLDNEGNNLFVTLPLFNHCIQWENMLLNILTLLSAKNCPCRGNGIPAGITWMFWAGSWLRTWQVLLVCFVLLCGNTDILWTVECHCFPFCVLVPLHLHNL